MSQHPAIAAAHLPSTAAEASDRLMLRGKAGFSHLARRSLIQAIRSGISRHELVAAVLIAFEHRDPADVANMLNLPLPAVLSLAESWNAKRLIEQRQQANETEIARLASSASPAAPKLFFASCTACGNRTASTRGPPPKCLICGRPFAGARKTDPHRQGI